MKFLIGITREPEKINEYFSQHKGRAETLTEIGPFMSRIDALNWLVYIKSRVANVEEIIPKLQEGSNALWHGFTFEQDLDS